LTDFNEIWHGDASGTSATIWPLRLTGFENPKWWLAVILKMKKGDMPAIT